MKPVSVVEVYTTKFSHSLFLLKTQKNLYGGIQKVLRSKFSNFAPPCCLSLLVLHPDWKPLFLLKIKIKQNPDCPNKEYNAILKHIHQNIRAYFRSKKNPSKVRRWQTSLVCSKCSWGSGGVVILGRFSNFEPHLSLETVFPALKLTQNCYIIMNISFS